MKKYSYLLCILLLQCKQSPEKNSNPPGKGYDYCYSNRRGVFVLNGRDGVGTEIKLGDASDIQLSPDGAYLAYTDINSPDHERRIGVMDLASKKTTLLDSACVNCYGPVWSPDGKYLAYNAMKGGKWNIKYVDRENTHAVFVSNADSGQLGCFSPSWTTDSKNIITQDMADIYLIDLNGKTIETIETFKIDTALLVNNASRFLMTKDRKLIYDGELSTDTSSEAELPVHIFSYDMHTKKLTQLTPDGYSCYQPVIKGDTVFFEGRNLRGDGRNASDVYAMPVNGGEFKEIFRKCGDFSCRTQQ